MAERLRVLVPEYERTVVKPRGFAEFCAMFDGRDHPNGIGLWESVLRDRRTGEVSERMWLKNALTDNGATAMLKNLFNASASAIAVANRMAVTYAQQGVTTLATTAIIAGNTVTSIPCAALPHAIVAGTILDVSIGLARAEAFTASGTNSAAATSITVVSQVAQQNHNIGDDIVPRATPADNPSSLTNAFYSGALLSGAYTFSGSGLGARQVAINNAFDGSFMTAASYTEAYLSNANPLVTGNAMAHAIFPPQIIVSTSVWSLTAVEKV
jgi:hypothetical protein